KVPARPTMASSAAGAACNRRAPDAVARRPTPEWTILNSDLAGVVPANQHRTEPTCRYFKYLPGWALVASLCVRHARRCVASAGAESNTRSIKAAARVRICAPNDYGALINLNPRCWQKFLAARPKR